MFNLPLYYMEGNFYCIYTFSIAFYHELMISEAGHYTLFLKLAKQYAAGLDVDKRWKEFLDFEATVIANYGNKDTVYG